MCLTHSWPSGYSHSHPFLTCLWGDNEHVLLILNFKELMYNREAMTLMMKLHIKVQHKLNKAFNAKSPPFIIKMFVLISCTCWTRKCFEIATISFESPVTRRNFCDRYIASCKWQTQPSWTSCLSSCPSCGRTVRMSNWSVVPSSTFLNTAHVSSTSPYKQHSVISDFVFVFCMKYLYQGRDLH